MRLGNENRWFVHFAILLSEEDEEANMRIPLDELRAKTDGALRFYGYDAEERRVLSEVLLYAQLRGNNQGIIKLIGAGIPRDAASGPIHVEHETALSARLDGSRQHGMLVLNHAVDLALEKAKASGFGIVGSHNTATSTGAIGYFAGRIAAADCIGIVASSSPGSVAFHGSTQALLGTNPIAFGIPSVGGSLVLDMSTSAIARYGVLEAQTAGAELPAGVAIDADGAATRDPSAALQGAILPFGGYKGAALSLMVEVLAGPLVGAACAGMADVSRNWGNLALALAPALLVDGETFLQQVADLAATLRAGTRLPGVEAIQLPGERGDAIRAAVEAEGALEIEDNLWQELCAVAARAGEA
ncbi:MAG: Ldh family oxidoreductase [Anaerolineaceae bacterium]|nr:Ldh family oxidoreductase [Anaerolineaceae bacterium]